MSNSAITATYSITRGPDGELWFTENGGGQVGEGVFATANLSVAPPSLNFGSPLTFTGSGFAPGENVKIYVSGVGSSVLAGATADSSGAFTATARATQSVWGQRIFLGLAQSSGKLGAAAFSMSPHLALHPDSGTAGSSAVALGSGFGSFQAVDLYWNSTNTPLGSATANLHGTFNGSAGLTFTIPVGASPGVYSHCQGSYPPLHVVGSFTVQ